MRWLNPLAWSGLVLLAVPLLVHLLSRQPPRTAVFPSLRFLTASPLRPTRRARVSDWWLLLLRCTIVTAAVAALAQPAPLASTAARSTGRPASRVVIVDTTAAGDPAQAMFTKPDDAGATLTLHRDASEIRAALTEAVAWLRAAPAPRALIVQSAFPAFALDSVDVARLPADVSLSLNALPGRTRRASPPIAPTAAMARDTIDWITALDSIAVARVLRVVRENGGDVVRSVRNASRFTTVITANDAAPDLEGSATAETPAAAAAWARLQSVARNDVLAQMTMATADSGAEMAGTPLHFTTAGNTAISGLVRDADSSLHAVIVSHVRERPALATALLLAASSHQTVAPLSPAVVQDDTYRDTANLRRWSGMPSAPPIGTGPAADRNTQPTYARYLWLLVVLLLAVEHVMRSRRNSESTAAGNT